MSSAPPHPDRLQLARWQDKHDDKQLDDLMLHEVEHCWGDVFWRGAFGDGGVPHAPEAGGCDRQMDVLTDACIGASIDPLPPSLLVELGNVRVTLQQSLVSSKDALDNFTLNFHCNVLVV